MANVDSPFGLKYRYCLHGGDPIIQTFLIPATDNTAVFLNDPVKPAGSASADGKYATVAQGTAAAQILGVVQGFDQVKGLGTSQNLYRTHRPASTAMYVKVITDPLAVYEIQEDSVAGALAADDIGLNASIIVGTGSAVTGLSAVELDTSTKADTATLELKIIGLVNRPDNELGTNAKVLVMINAASFGGGTGMTGI